MTAWQVPSQLGLALRRLEPGLQVSCSSASSACLSISICRLILACPEVGSQAAGLLILAAAAIVLSHYAGHGAPACMQCWNSCKQLPAVPRLPMHVPQSPRRLRPAHLLAAQLAALPWRCAAATTCTPCVSCPVCGCRLLLLAVHTQRHTPYTEGQRAIVALDRASGCLLKSQLTFEIDAQVSRPGQGLTLSAATWPEHRRLLTQELHRQAGPASTPLGL